MDPQASQTMDAPVFTPVKCEPCMTKNLECDFIDQQNQGELGCTPCQRENWERGVSQRTSKRLVCVIPRQARLQLERERDGYAWAMQGLEYERDEYAEAMQQQQPFIGPLLPGREEAPQDPAENAPEEGQDVHDASAARFAAKHAEMAKDLAATVIEVYKDFVANEITPTETQLPAALEPAFEELLEAADDWESYEMAESCERVAGLEEAIKARQEELMGQLRDAADWDAEHARLMEENRVLKERVVWYESLDGGRGE
ncbi:hypothetical protein LTR86_008181 [Recurvomyces mirabilis]|nr:hypothetical protein LTR86_008181 [Recurvomyces mirabilis]